MSADDTLTIPLALAEELLVDYRPYYDSRLDELHRLVNPPPTVTDEMVEALVERYVELSYPTSPPRVDDLDRTNLRAALTAALEAGWTPPESDGEGAADGAATPSPSLLRPLTEADYAALTNAAVMGAINADHGGLCDHYWVDRNDGERVAARAIIDRLLITAAQRGVYPAPEPWEPTDEDVEALAEVLWEQRRVGERHFVPWRNVTDTAVEQFESLARAAFEWMGEQR